MSATENKHLMQRIFAEFAKGNPDLFLASMAEDFRWTIIGTTKFSGTYQGKQTVIEKLLEEVSFSAGNHTGQPVKIDAAYVDRALNEVADDEDLSRYVL